MAEYQPTVADVMWTENLLASLCEGANWGTSAAVYKVRKAEQILEIIAVVAPRDHKSMGNIEAVFKFMGWTVTEEFVEEEGHGQEDHTA
jgi:hypothetical protein